VKYRKITFWICAVLAIATSAATIATVSRASDNVLGRPLGWFFLVVLALALLYTIWQMMKEGAELKSFLGSALTIVALAGIAAVGNYPEIVPARGTPPDTSLTVTNSASGHLTLQVMLIVAIIGCPLVLLYTAYVYKTFRGKTKAADAEY